MLCCAVVDVDSDGDADTLYFPVTAAYKPASKRVV